MQTMKVKKGDTVQITAGKDRGKQGRVIEASPAKQKVVVENLNMIKRHQRPRPITNSSRMGGATMSPGGIIDMPSAVPVGNVMVVERSITRPAPVGITLIRVQDDPDARESSWTNLALSGVDIRPLVAPGLTHHNLEKEPYVELLAAELAGIVRTATNTRAAPERAAVLNTD